MNPLIASALVGVATACVLYVCVRLRMRIGPWMREHHGDRARRLFWGLSLVLMVLIANVGLYVVRDFVVMGDQSLAPQVVYALALLLVGVGLVFRYIHRDR